MKQHTPSPDDKRNFEDNLSEWIFDDSLEERRLAPLKGLIKRDPELKQLKGEFEQLKEFLDEEAPGKAPVQLKKNVMDAIEGRGSSRRGARGPSSSPARWATAASLLAVAVLAGRELWTQADSLHQPMAVRSGASADEKAMPAKVPADRMNAATVELEEQVYKQQLKSTVERWEESKPAPPADPSYSRMASDNPHPKPVTEALAQNEDQRDFLKDEVADRNNRRQLEQLEGDELDKEVARVLQDQDVEKKIQQKVREKLNEGYLGLAETQSRKNRAEDADDGAMPRHRIRVSKENREVFLRWCYRNGIKPNELRDNSDSLDGAAQSGVAGKEDAGSSERKRQAETKSAPARPQSPAELEFRSGRLEKLSKKKSADNERADREPSKDAAPENSKNSVSAGEALEKAANAADGEWLYFEIMPIDPEALKQLEKEIAEAEEARKKAEAKK